MEEISSKSSPESKHTSGRTERDIPISNDLSLDAILENYTQTKRENVSSEVDMAMSILPASVPPTRDLYAGLIFTSQLKKTLVIGTDLHKPMDIFGKEEYRQVTQALLTEQIQQLNSLQRHVWPHIANGRSCVIIGGTNPKKGKSLSYLAPMAYTILEQTHKIQEEGNLGAIGPLGIIICGTSKSCGKVSAMLLKLLAGTRFEVLAVSEHDKNSKHSLKTHTDFVVTTITAAQDLFQNHFDKFQFERLRFLVFDDAQLNLKNHYSEVEDLIGKVGNYRRRMDDANPIQTVFCGTEWDTRIGSAAVNVSDNTVLLIESSIAALQYGAIKFKAHFFHDPGEKLDKVSEIVRELPERARVIIACNEPETLEEVAFKIFKSNGIRAFGLHHMDPLIAEKRRQLKTCWENGPTGRGKFVLLVTDPVLRDVTISDADVLVHFDLSTGKKEAFADRHMCMWNHFPNVFDYETIGDAALESKVPLLSHVFITNQEPELYKIVLKLHSIGVDIPTDLYSYAERERKIVLNRSRLCEGFKAFGKCINTDPCSARHQFNLKDLSQDCTLPKIGRIQVEIIDSEDVNIYVGKLLSYYEAVNKKKENVINFINREKETHRLMQQYYSDIAKRMECSSIRIGTFCVVQDQDQQFRRGRVAMILDDDDEANDPQCRVYCVDYGTYLIRRRRQLYVLPERFSMETRNPVCVKLYVAGLKPMGEEPCFSSRARTIAKQFIGRIFTGKIVLTMGSDVWVAPLVEYKRGPNGEWLQQCNMRVEIMKTFYLAQKNPDHMELLWESCENVSGLSYDHYRGEAIVGNDIETLFHPKGGKVEWAHLPVFQFNESECPTIPAWCTFYKTLSMIFIQRADRTDSLDALVDEIDKSVEAMIEERYQKYRSVFEQYYELGLPIAAYEKNEQKWNRGIIVDKYNHNGEVAFDIFFVDHGDFGTCVRMKSMFPLRKEFVTKLPFQAIMLRLSHIAPMDMELTTETEPNVNWEFDAQIDVFIQPHLIDEDLAQKLDVSALRKVGFHQDNDVELCRIYDAFIMGYKETIEIGEMVVENNMAKYVPGAKEKVQKWKDFLLSYWNKAVDKELQMDDDSSENDGESEFDIDLGLWGPDPVENVALAKDILKDLGFAKEIEDATESLKAQSLNSPKALEASANSGSEGTNILSLRAKAGVSSLPPIPSIGPHFKKPTVEWSQSRDQIQLWIRIPDLVEYSIDLDLSPELPQHCLSFQSQDPSGYGFCLELVGKVVQPVEQNLTGQELMLKVKKLSVGFRWPYLLKGNPSLHWLKRRIDGKLIPDFVKDDSEDESQLPRKGDIEIPDPESSEDSEDEVVYSDEILSDEDVEAGGGGLVEDAE